MSKRLSKAALEAIRSSVKVRALLMIQWDVVENTILNWTSDPASPKLTNSDSVSKIAEGSGLKESQILVS